MAKKTRRLTAKEIKEWNENMAELREGLRRELVDRVSKTIRKDTMYEKED